VLRALGAVPIVIALGLQAAPAGAAPPAAGAPGAIHTWAPADKRGFGTSHSRASTAYFTLRAASLTEVYHPDLSTPAFRGLQFVVTDGKTFVDRETVDDDPRPRASSQCNARSRSGR
jgi:glucoamylase